MGSYMLPSIHVLFIVFSEETAPFQLCKTVLEIVVSLETFLVFYQASDTIITTLLIALQFFYFSGCTKTMNKDENISDKLIGLGSKQFFWNKYCFYFAQGVVCGSIFM